MTAAAKETDESMMLKAQGYLEEIVRYPADIVIAVCRRLTDVSTFFPAWAELRRRLEAEMAYRRRMAEAWGAEKNDRSADGR